MTRGGKLLDRMRESPNGWTIEDIATLCDTNGIACTPPRKGSHYKVKHPAVARILTIPARRPIKPVYIRELVSFVDEVREVSG